MKATSPFGEYHVDIPSELEADWQTREALLLSDHGDRDYRPQACQLLESMLAKLDRDTNPEIWAEVAHDLAMSWAKRDDGSPVENLHRALLLYRDALDLLDPEHYPCTCALFATSLGSAFSSLAEFRGADCHLRALKCSQYALSLLPLGREPRLRASILCNLGNAYAAMPLGDRRLNLEEAARHYREALDLVVSSNLSDLVMPVRQNLVAARSDLAELAAAGVEPELVEDLRELLAQVDPKTEPIQWGECALQLARTLPNAIGSDSGQALQEAVSLQATAIALLEAHQSDFSHALHLVEQGEALVRLSQYTDDAHLRLGMRILDKARAMVTDISDSSQKAIILYELGDTYRVLPGNGLDNLHFALESLFAALELASEVNTPQLLAEISDSLGLVLLYAPTINPQAMLERAAGLFDRALALISEQQDPVYRATLLTNRAQVLTRLRYDDRKANISEAIGSLREAAGMFSESGQWVKYGECQSQLGQTLLDLAALGDRRLDEAEEYARDAIEYLDTAGTQLQLATALHVLGRTLLWSLQPTGGEAVAEVRDTLERALSIYETQQASERAALAMRDLSRMYAHVGRWEQAAATFAQRDHLLYEALGRSLVPGGRSTEQYSIREILREAAYCFAHIGDLTAAIRCLEDSQAILDVRNEDESPLAEALAELRSHESDHRRMLLWPSQLKERVDLDYAGRVSQSRSKLDGAKYPLPGSPLRDLIRMDLHDAALAYLAETAHGGMVILVSQGADSEPNSQVIWLDALHSDRVTDLLRDGDGDLGLLHCIAEGESDELRDWLDRNLETLGTQLLRPVLELARASGAESVVLVPCGRLDALPYSAASVVGNPSLARPTLSVLPSARYLASEQPVNAAGKALMVANPRHVRRVSLSGMELDLPLPDLAFARHECDALLSLTDSGSAIWLTGTNADLDAVLNYAQDARYVHLACHGVFDPVDYMSSGLLLSGKTRLTLRDIGTKLSFRASPVVVLSACQTAISDFASVHSDMLSLPRALLAAGARGIVSALWPVADVAAALLIECFWRNHLDRGFPAAESLALAQRWLRDGSADDFGLVRLYESLVVDSRSEGNYVNRIGYYRTHGAEKPFEDPFFWAGFVYTGNP